MQRELQECRGLWVVGMMLVQSGHHSPDKVREQALSRTYTKPSSKVRESPP